MRFNNWEVRQPFGALALPEARALVRNKKLLKVLWWSLPVAILVFLVGVWWTGLYFWSVSSERASEQGQWSKVESSYAKQVKVAAYYPESWLPEYNLGTSLVAQSQYDAGIERLESAFVGVPKAIKDESGRIEMFSYECSVRMNLSAAHEMVGDDFAAAEEVEEAETSYGEALEWAEPCQGVANPPFSAEEQEDQPQSGSDDQPKDDPEDDSGGDSKDDPQPEPEEDDQGQQPSGTHVVERLQEKIDDLHNDPADNEPDPNKPDQGENDDDPFAKETEEQKERREELEQKNQEQDERLREEQEERHRTPGHGKW